MKLFTGKAEISPGGGEVFINLLSKVNEVKCLTWDDWKESVAGTKARLVLHILILSLRSMLHSLEMTVNVFVSQISPCNVKLAIVCPVA